MRLLLLIAVHWFFLGSFLAGLPLATGDDNDDAVQELVEIQEERRKAVEKLNRFNPLSESFAGAGILSPGPPPAFLAVRQLFTQENRKLFAIAEGGWVFLIFCLQVFRSGRPIPLWKRAFELLWIIVLFWSVALVAIPLFTLGTSALTVLKDLGVEFAGAL